MKLTLLRKTQTSRATLGDLYIDNSFVCHTLEDVVRDLGPKGEGKVFGETAIPAGTYKVIVNMSPRFGKLLPRLLDVPYFTGILIHKGNKSADTHGCILVGNAIGGDDLVTDSTGAWEAFFPKVKAAFDAHESIVINVVNDFTRT